MIAIEDCLSTSRQVQGTSPDALGLFYIFPLLFVSRLPFTPRSVRLKVAICVPAQCANLCNLQQLEFAGKFLKSFSQLFGCA